MFCVAAAVDQLFHVVLDIVYIHFREAAERDRDKMPMKQVAVRYLARLIPPGYAGSVARVFRQNSKRLQVVTRGRSEKGKMYSAKGD